MEWRNTEGGMALDKEEDREDEYNNPVIMRMFDWKSYCYDLIPQEQ
jgi:hypothetical protein